MKYSYFSAERAGKCHYHFTALMNGKSIARPKENCGIACTIYMPSNNTIQWFWIDKDNNTRWLREYRNYENIDWLGTVNDLKLRPKDNKKSKHWLARGFIHDYPQEIDDTCVWLSNRYHEFFNKFFECDHLLHPEMLLGYWGFTKADREGMSLSDCLLADERYMKVDLDYSISQMKKRKNIIVYKDDIRKLARSWFLGGGQLIDISDELYYNNISLRINEARKIPRSMQVALDRFDIPYEVWSLDKGDYGVFGFDKNLPRYETEGCDCTIKPRHQHKVEGWIERYVKEYSEI